MTTWICTHCGGSQVSVNASRPSIDDRFAIGSCERIKSAVVLVPNTEANQAAIDARVELARQKRADQRAAREAARRGE